MKRLAKVRATRREFMTTTGAAATVALLASDVRAEAVAPGDVAMMSAREMFRSIQEKKLSSRELVQSHLDRIREVNPALNAVVQLAEERALLEADKADAALSKGKVLGPVSTVPAVKHGETANIDTANYQQPYNLTGWPAAVVRCGTSEEGLPIGLQVIGRSWREDVVLAVASLLEAEFGGWQTT